VADLEDTMTLAMPDSDESHALPPGYPAYAGYVDGGIGDQPNAARIATAFPSAHHLSIALFAHDDADALDVEPQAASPSDVQGWVTRQHVRGIVRPCIYASVSAMKNEILPLVRGWLPGSVRLWTAHYGQGEHICGPKTCGELSIDADGTQWTDAYRTPSGAVVDMSVLADDFFGTPEPPSAWVFGAVRGLKAVPGHTSVLLSWSAPADPAPAPVAHYQVTVRKDGEDVKSYPRDVPKAGSAQSWQGGSLTPGTTYEVLVRAVTADVNGHGSPWAAVTFTTGHG
jgi:hypothetical protein